MDLSKLSGHIWLDGEMVPWQEARVHVLTHTFHYGLGVFEGVRAYQTSDGPCIFRLEDHTDRLFRSAHIHEGTTTGQLARNLFCRQVQCWQILAGECADRAADAGAHITNPRPYPPIDILCFGKPVTFG